VAAQPRYPNATRLLITADGGGSNGSRVRLRKRELQKLANELGLDVVVNHLPPGISTWSKIEHRLCPSSARIGVPCPGSAIR
jgi:Rhodopirellula transposase DDE domain